MSVKRYSLEDTSTSGYHVRMEMVEDQHFGEWVRYEDYVALDEEWKAAARQIEKAVSQCVTLVAGQRGDPEGSPHTMVIG